MTIDQAYELLKNEQAQAALTAFEQIAQDQPNNADAHHGIGMAYVHLGLVEEAMAPFGRACTLAPSVAAFHQHFASAAKSCGHVDIAERHYLEALRLYPCNPEALNGLGALYYRAGRLGEAIEQFRLALELTPDFFAALSNLGDCYSLREEFEAAEACYLKAYKQHASARIAHNLGIVQVKLGEFAKAKPLLEQVSNDTDDADAWFHLGIIYQQEQDPRAITAYQKAVQAKNTHYEAHHNLACIYLATGRTDAALEHFVVSNNISPNPTAKHFINALKGKTPDSISPQFVEQLFDQYAGHYEQHLKELGYTLPFVARESFAEVWSETRMLDILDCGVGTGLGAVAFADMTNTIDGVDLSEEMLHMAKSKGGYNKLVQQDATAYCNSNKLKYDLALALELVNYIHPVEPFLAAAYTTLKPAGMLIVSIETADVTALQKSGRVAYNIEEFLVQINNAGFSVINQKQIPLRKHEDSFVQGAIIIAKK